MKDNSNQIIPKGTNVLDFFKKNDIIGAINRKIEYREANNLPQIGEYDAVVESQKDESNISRILIEEE